MYFCINKIYNGSFTEYQSQTLYFCECTYVRVCVFVCCVCFLTTTWCKFYFVRTTTFHKISHSVITEIETFRDKVTSINEEWYPPHNLNLCRKLRVVDLWSYYMWVGRRSWLTTFSLLNLVVMNSFFLCVVRPEETLNEFCYLRTVLLDVFNEKCRS